MGRGPKRKAQDVMTPQAMREPAPNRGAVAASHYEEHLGNVNSTLDHVAALIASEIGADPSRIKKYVAGAGLVGLAGAFLTPFAPIAATAFAGFAAYKSWSQSGAWFQTNIGRSLAQHFGYEPKSGRLRSIASKLLPKGLGALGGAAASAIAFGTPLLPVAGLAMGGYVAYKAARVWRSKRKLDKMSSQNSEQTPETSDVFPELPDPDDIPIGPSDEMPPPSDGQSERTYTQEDIENAQRALERRQRRQEREATMAARRRERRRERRTRRAEQRLADELSTLPGAIAREIGAESAEHTRQDIRDDLRQENVAADRDFVEEVSPEAVEARMISLAAGSREIDFSTEEGKEIARLTYETEKKLFQNRIKAIDAAARENKKNRDQALKALDAQEKELRKKIREEVRAAMKDQIAEARAAQRELTKLRDSMSDEIANPPKMPEDELASYIEELTARKAQYNAQLEHIDQALSSVKETEDHYVEAGFREQHEKAFREERQRIERAFESNERRLAMEKSARQSTGIGQIDGLANLTVAAGGTLACARCGTRPKSVRVRCSKCGMPFVIEEKYRDYIGNSDDDLRRKGKLDLVEKYEGSAETREMLWNKARKGKRIRTFKDSEGSSKGSSSGSGKKSSGSGKKGAAQKAADYSSSEPSIVSPVELHKDMQPDGDFDRQAYLEQQKAKREGENPELGMFIVGHDPFENDFKDELGQTGEYRDLHPTDAMLEGVMGWEWNTNSKSKEMAPGDTIAIRKNKTKPAEIGGFFTIGEKMELQLPGLKSLGAEDVDDLESFLRDNHPELMSQIEAVADKVMATTDPKYYPRQAVIDNILGSFGDNNKTMSFLSVTDPHKLDNFSDESLVAGNYGTGMGPVCMNNPGKDSRMTRTTQLIATKEAQDNGIKEKETQAEYEERIAKKVAVAESAAEASERLMSAIEEKRAAEAEKNGGKYPGEGFGLDPEGRPQVCGVKTADGHPCRRPVRPRTQYCWQHQGGPRKGESALSKEEIVASQEALQKSWETDHSEAAQSSPQERSESGSRIPIGRKKAEEFINGANSDPAKSETFEKCGMTERELAQYANAYLEACNPKPGETVAVYVSYEAQRPLAEVIESLARERGMEPEVFYPDANNEEQLDELNKLEQEGKLIVGFLDQVGAMEEGIPGIAFGGGARWNVTMTPTRGWAALLAKHHEITGFPEDEEEAFAQLVEDLQSFTYSDRGVSGTRDHLEELERRAEKMNDLGIQEVTISSPEIAGPGTDTNLRMKMLKGSRWMTVDMPSGIKNPEGRDDDVQCNTATEEYWGTPDPDSLEGNFTSSAPLALERAGENPIVAEQVRGVFENGQLVSLDAYKQNEQGEWVKDETTQQEMERFFFGERGRPKDKQGNPAPFPQCGELGVVDSENRVAATGRHYLTPMIDEHGGIHLAIGDSYEVNGGGKDNRGSHTGDGTIWEENHIDVRIGSMETTLRGKTKDGSFIDVIKNGVSVI